MLANALATRGRDDPRPDPFRMFDAVQILGETEPYRLRRFSCVGSVQIATACDGPYERSEPCDQRVPTGRVTAASAANERCRRVLRVAASTPHAAQPSWCVLSASVGLTVETLTTPSGLPHLSAPYVKTESGVGQA